MSVVVITKVPMPRPAVEEFSRRVDANANPPKGLIVHTATAVSDGCEIIDLWESEDEFRSFFAARIIPLAKQFATEMGVDMPEGGFEPEVRDAFDITMP